VRVFSTEYPVLGTVSEELEGVDWGTATRTRAWRCWKCPCRRVVPPLGDRDLAHYFTLTWNPAALSAFTTASASKSPVTSNVSVLAFTVSLVTPSTFLSVFLIAVLHWPQQLWMPVRVSVFTFPLGTASSLIITVLLSVSPWNPPAARASIAFCAVASSLAVMVIVLAFWSHLPVTAAIPLRISPAAFTHCPQQRCVPLSSTLVSARPKPAAANRTEIAATETTLTRCMGQSLW